MHGYFPRRFYSNQICEGAILVTGVSRIGMDGIFNGANHLVDVIFPDQTNGFLEISWEEIRDHKRNALSLIPKRNKLK